MFSKTTRPALTSEDLELLATPDVHLRESASVFCFDQERFKARIYSGERWQQLLQAHLYYDHVITRILFDALKNPDAINLRRIGFYQKVQLISAMNLLPSDIVTPIDFINSLRNKIAHKLDFEITDDRIVDFVDCTPKFLRDAAVDEDGRQPGPLLFHELLRVILLQVEVFRQQHEYQRLVTRKAELRLRAVLDRTEVVYRE